MADGTVVVKKSFLKRLIDKGKQAPTVIVERARSAGRSAIEIVRNPRRGVHMVKNELFTDGNGVFSLLIGAGTGFLVNMDAFKKSEWLKRNWYALPLAMIGLGYFLVRKHKPYGKTLMTLGGILFVQAYQNRPKDTDKKDADKKTTDDPYWDTAAPPMAAPPGARWIVTADGQHVLVPVRYPPHNALPPRSREPDHIARTADEIYGRTA